jgi:hypothetical protein
MGLPGLLEGVRKMTNLDDSTAIACTLDGGEFRKRMVSIADLNRTALQSHRRNDLKLELLYAPVARDRVREMVAREKECCAFLNFTMREEQDGVRLIIEAPEASRGVIDSLFEPFETRQPASSDCGCSSSTRR